MTRKAWVALPGLLLLAGTAGAAMLAPGDPFPAWALVDQNGREIASKDYAGTRYLLWFYAKASTPG